ncbi:MAG TPA: hypothetical protein VGT44_08615, partial [Ktedonobacteraceae bacterium]|nr:hypothetical protein [Ktedonobacteraceae bacterium]
MIVLHALWDHRAADATGRLHIWAESSQMPLPVGAGRKARGRQPQKEEKPREHPFALHYELLRQSLGELVGRLHISGGEASTLDVRLPSTDKGPLASPELILDEVEALQATAFLPYTVPTLALTPDFA